VADMTQPSERLQILSLQFTMMWWKKWQMTTRASDSATGWHFAL